MAFYFYDRIMIIKIKSHRNRPKHIILYVLAYAQVDSNALHLNPLEPRIKTGSPCLQADMGIQFWRTIKSNFCLI